MLNKEPPTPGHGTSEALLRSEIGFWRELITSWDGPPESESLERMQQALALAESRLCGLYARYRDTRADGSRHGNTVHYLDFSS